MSGRRLEKSRIFILPHAGYPFDVMVAIGAADEQVERAVTKRGHTLSAEERSALAVCGEGRTCMLSGGQTVLRLEKWTGTSDDYGHLAHEIFHAVEFLMNRIGMTLTEASDEAYAYAIGNLTKRIHEHLARKRK